MTLAEIARVLGGSVTPGDEHLAVAAPAFVDSRQLVPGGLFVAIAGERADGHDFARVAVDGGAAAMLGSRAVGVPAVLVGDVQTALGVLAKYVLSRMTGLTVVGLTGSQGKTSTKDMLAEIFGAAAPTVAPEGSFNTEIGVPLTALRVVPDSRYLVAEMGARGAGHIAYLADMVGPSIGLVLNVGLAHVGEFGSQDAIAAAKGELVEALPAAGLAVLNADDDRVAGMAARTSAEVLRFGTAGSADMHVSDVGLDDAGHTMLRLRWEGRTADITLRYIGEHHAMNAAAAATVAVGAGLDFGAVADSLRRATPRSHWRMEVSTNPEGVIVINDAYNANPDSMRAALRALMAIATRRGAGRVFAVLGDMRELGASSRGEHEAIGRLAATLGVDVLVAVGDSARPIRDAAGALSGWAGEAHLTRSPAEALELLRGAVRKGDVVLVKASRAAGLESLAVALAEGTNPSARGEGVL